MKDNINKLFFSYCRQGYYSSLFELIQKHDKLIDYHYVDRAKNTAFVYLLKSIFNNQKHNSYKYNDSALTKIMPILAEKYKSSSYVDKNNNTYLMLIIKVTKNLEILKLFLDSGAKDANSCETDLFATALSAGAANICDYLLTLSDQCNGHYLKDLIDLKSPYLLKKYLPQLKALDKSCLSECFSFFDKGEDIYIVMLKTILEEFATRGISLDVTDKYNRPLIWYAIEKEYLYIVQILAKSATCFTIVDTTGVSVLDLFETKFSNKKDNAIVKSIYKDVVDVVKQKQVLSLCVKEVMQEVGQERKINKI